MREKMLSLWWKQKEELENWRTGREEGGISERRTPRCVSSEDRIKRNNSHVKAQVLLLLKEVVQDVLPDKVWV